MIGKLLMSWLIVAGYLLTGGVAADSLPMQDDPDGGTLSLYFENDLFAETDQNYTNGIRLSLVSPDLSSFDERFIDNPAIQTFFRSLNKRLKKLHPSPRDGSTSRRVVLSLGQTIYTPETIDVSELLEDERPYAGWLYLGVAYHARTRAGDSVDQLETVGVNLGIVGPAALGQQAQDFIHDLRGFDKFQGWDNQLENEPGLQLIYEKKHKLISRTDGDEFGYDLISHYGGSLGNIAVYGNAGAEIRGGWRIPDDFGTSALRPGGDNSAPDGRRRSGPGFHVFASVDTRLVAHDIFLDGNTFRSSHSVDKEYLVADLAVGASLVWDEFKLSFARIHRTKEFRNQDESHNYGSLSLTWNFSL